MSAKINIPIEYHKQICELYLSGKGSPEIGKLFGVSRFIICKLLKSYNIEIRGFIDKLLKDKTFFKKIDSVNKAYWFGLLCADGCNTGVSFAIYLQELDKYIIQRFIKELKFSGDIKKQKRQLPTHQDKFGFAVSGREISKDLTKLGCPPRKSLILQFPNENQVPIEYINHFIRGYFDGNGSVDSKSSKEEMQVEISSSHKFAYSLSDLLRLK